MFQLVTTVFDAALMFMLIMVGAVSDKKYLKVCIVFIIVYIMNLFCIWGIR